jgi:hypothetical protein
VGSNHDVAFTTSTEVSAIFTTDRKLAHHCQNGRLLTKRFGSWKKLATARSLACEKTWLKQQTAWLKQLKVSGHDSSRAVRHM